MKLRAIKSVYQLADARFLVVIAPDRCWHGSIVRVCRFVGRQGTVRELPGLRVPTIDPGAVVAGTKQA